MYIQQFWLRRAHRDVLDTSIDLSITWPVA